MFQQGKAKKNYKGGKCKKCCIEISIGSKSGFCKRCAPARLLSDTEKKNASLRMIGNKIWLGRKLSEEHKIKISLSNKGKNKGRKMPIEYRMMLSKLRSGSNHPNWQGGKTEKNRALRHTIEYRNWREAVFLRDDWTCVFCGVRGVYLEADHIKPFCDYIDLRFDISNGRTLCRDCHSKTDTYKGKSKKGKTKACVLNTTTITDSEGQPPL